MHRARVGVLCVHSASIALSKSKIVGGSFVPAAPRSFWWAGLISRLQRLYFATFGDTSLPQPSADSRKHIMPPARQRAAAVGGNAGRAQIFSQLALGTAGFDDSLDFLSASKDDSFVKATGFLPGLPVPAVGAAAPSMPP